MTPSPKMAHRLSAPPAKRLTTFMMPPWLPADSR